MEKLTQQEQVRRQKMQDLIDMGIDPFGSRYDRTSNSGIIKSSYEDKTKEELDELQVTVKIAGRIMTKRRQGKAGFMNIQDREGQIQIYVRKDEIGDDQYEIFKKNDIGDIVGIEGTVMKTDHGQLSVRAKNYTHLSKSLRPLPEKFHGLTDVEERFRRRYVDLIMNPEAKHIALTRPKIIRAIQHYLDGQGLVEVETPVMQPILGGASARPFVTHHNTLNMDFYLRIATELPLKRLIVGGLEGVYEIGRLFRNEGMDAMHNPEFTTVEAYVAYSDLHGMMDLIEGLFDSVANEVLGTTDITYQGTQLSLKAPFKRIHMVDAIKEACGVDFWQDMSYEEAVKLAKETSKTKFDASVEVSFRLNVDPRHADQQIRGAMVLPNGTGKTQRVCVVAQGEKEKEAQAAGADFVGGADIIEKISKGWFDFDVLVATPDMMGQLGRLGRVLGPKGLMPNPKTGTVTMDVAKAIDEIKKGKVTYRVDKEGNVNLAIGKTSFTDEALVENFNAIFNTIAKARPATVKGAYMKNLVVSTTMGPGIHVEIVK